MLKQTQEDSVSHVGQDALEFTRVARVRNLRRFVAAFIRATLIVVASFWDSSCQQIVSKSEFNGFPWGSKYVHGTYFGASGIRI